LYSQLRQACCRFISFSVSRKLSSLEWMHGVGPFTVGDIQTRADVAQKLALEPCGEDGPDRKSSDIRRRIDVAGIPGRTADDYRDFRELAFRQ
jgi:hypothetical protein